jgi:hypothetical protein
LEETLDVFIRHVLSSNFLGLKPFTEVCRDPNLPADQTPLESLFIEVPGERIEIGNQWTCGLV